MRDDSVFVDWQRVRVQENVDEVSTKMSAMIDLSAEC